MGESSSLPPKRLSRTRVPILGPMARPCLVRYHGSGSTSPDRLTCEETGVGWADENGDWLRNILYLSKSTTAIGCGACPPFHHEASDGPPVQMVGRRSLWASLSHPAR